jgi:hypothetical protein
MGTVLTNTAYFLEVLIEVLRVTLKLVTILIVPDIRQVYIQVTWITKVSFILFHFKRPLPNGATRSFHTT